MSKEIGSPHNYLFQSILGREDMARDFIRYYMPAKIVADLDVDTLAVASESYVSDDLKESLSDIVLSLQFKNGDPAEIYILIEHKSGPDKHAKLQILKYLNANADVSPKEVENRVKHLPKGEETVRTTAERLREEGYKMALRDKDKWIGESKIEGRIEAAQEILIDLASEQYGVLPSILEEKIKSIQSDSALRNLSRKIFQMNDINEFQKLLNQVTDH